MQAADHLPIYDLDTEQLLTAAIHKIFYSAHRNIPVGMYRAGDFRTGIDGGGSLDDDPVPAENTEIRVRISAGGDVDLAASDSHVFIGHNSHFGNISIQAAAAIDNQFAFVDPNSHIKAICKGVVTFQHDSQITYGVDTHAYFRGFSGRLCICNRGIVQGQGVGGHIVACLTAAALYRIVRRLQYILTVYVQAVHLRFGLYGANVSALLQQTADDLSHQLMAIGVGMEVQVHICSGNKVGVAGVIRCALKCCIHVRYFIVSSACSNHFI